MKKTPIILTLLLVASTIYTRAQDSTYALTGRKSFTFGINGLNGITGNGALSGGLLYRVYKTEKKANRFGLYVSGGYDPKFDDKNNPKQYLGLTYDYHKENISIAASVGKEYHFYKKKRLDIYTLIDLKFSLEYQNEYTKMSLADSVSLQKNNTSFPYNYYNTRENRYYLNGYGYGNYLKSSGDYIQGNYSTTKLGLGGYVGIGFNYFLTSNMSIGAEFSYGINIYPISFTNEKIEGIYQKKPYDYEIKSNRHFAFNAGDFRALIMFQVFFK